MKIDFALTTDDAREFHLASNRRARRSATALALLAGPVLVLASALFLGLLVSPGWLCLAVVPALLIALSWRSYFGFWRYDADECRSWLPPDNAFTARVTPEHILVTSDLSKSLYRWTAFSRDRSYETPGLFVLTGADASLVIPKRAFKVPADVEAFRELVKTRLGT